LIFAPGAEHPCAAEIRGTVFADAGFNVKVRAADPEISPKFFPGLLYNAGYFLTDSQLFPRPSYFLLRAGTQNIPPAHSKTGFIRCKNILYIA
jgi:hypothetical protein